jgi:hypothetical protein
MDELVELEGIDCASVKSAEPVPNMFKQQAELFVVVTSDQLPSSPPSCFVVAGADVVPKALTSWHTGLEIPSCAHTRDPTSRVDALTAATASDRVDDQLYAGRSVDDDRDHASRLARSSARVSAAANSKFEGLSGLAAVQPGLERLGRDHVIGVGDHNGGIFGRLGNPWLHAHQRTERL